MDVVQYIYIYHDILILLMEEFPNNHLGSEKKTL